MRWPGLVALTIALAPVAAPALGPVRVQVVETDPASPAALDVALRWTGEKDAPPDPAAWVTRMDVEAERRQREAYKAYMDRPTPVWETALFVYLAASPGVARVTGGDFYECRPATPSPEAGDDAAARRLWEETARLAGLPASSGRRPPTG